MDDTIEKRGPGRPPKNRVDERMDEMRPALRTEGPEYDREAELARAETLAREIRENQSGLSFEPGMEFHIPPHWIPAGFTYQWKRVETLGKSDDDNVRAFYQGGWKPVPANRHPQLCAVGFGGETIIKGGLMLVECPTVIVNEMRQRERREAIRAVKDKEAQLGQGAAGAVPSRGDASDVVGVRPSVSSSFEPHARQTEIPA